MLIAKILITCAFAVCSAVTIRFAVLGFPAWWSYLLAVLGLAGVLWSAMLTRKIWTEYR